MRISIYLHQYVVDILGQYGELQDVINKILNEASVGKFSFEDKPACASRDGASRYDVDVTNKEYLELIMTYPTNSPRISLRRLVYWFVDNEIMYELGWLTKRKYVSKPEEKRVKRCNAAIDELYKLQKAISNSHNYELIDEIRLITQRLENLKEDIRRG